jgi:hypothetical protein
MAALTCPATAATAPQQWVRRLLQTPLRNSLATVRAATPATALQRLCNKPQQPRNSLKNRPRNSATVPYRGGDSVAPLTRGSLLRSQLRSAGAALSLRARYVERTDHDR